MRKSESEKGSNRERIDMSLFFFERVWIVATHCCENEEILEEIEIEIERKSLVRFCVCVQCRMHTIHTLKKG